MRVELHERHLHEMRERFRTIHELNLAQLQKTIQRNVEHALKLVNKVQQKPPAHTVDVFV